MRQAGRKKQKKRRWLEGRARNSSIFPASPFDRACIHISHILVHLLHIEKSGWSQITRGLTSNSMPSKVRPPSPQEDDILGAKLKLVESINYILVDGGGLDIALDSTEFCGCFPKHHGEEEFIACCRQLEAWARYAFPSFRWNLTFGEDTGGKHCRVHLSLEALLE